MLGLLLAVEVAGLLATTGTGIILPVSGAQSVGLSISPTLLGVVRVQTSLDGGVTFWDEPAAGPVYLGTSSTQYSGSFPLPPGATHAQLIVRDWTSGSSPARLWTSQATGPARATGSGTLAATFDAVTIPVDPGKWAAVLFSVPAYGGVNCVLVWEYSIDGGTNWLAGPRACRTDSTFVCAALFSGALSTFSASYEMPIPGDATHVRWRTTSLSSGSIPFSIYPWRPYVPGTVVATLYDATSAVNTALSVRQQLSGWTTLLWGFSSASSSGMTYGVYDLDDVGAIIGAYVFSIGSPSMYGSLGAGVSGNVSGALLGTTAASAISPKRSDFSSAGIVGGTSRIRIEARR